MTEVPSVGELRAAAARQGIEPDEAELAAVREFLAVFLPAVESLGELLPEGAPGPAPLPPE
ncbi:MAG TPA: hypothetical protein VFB42_06150 [Gaiellaceae bacterium]|nr:hypothetical protein [Gaiellaceae bacterium]